MYSDIAYHCYLPLSLIQEQQERLFRVCVVNNICGQTWTRLGYYDVTARLILLMICLVILLLFTICCMIFVICYLLFFIICYLLLFICFFLLLLVFCSLLYVIWHFFCLLSVSFYLLFAICNLLFFVHIVPVSSFGSFRAQKPSRLENYKALKS